MTRRIGIFGGAFDPVHDAHVALGHAALEQLALDELRWVPTSQPWYKSRELTASAHRLAMVALAVADEPRFTIDARELERAGPSYTLDTVIEMQTEYLARVAAPGLEGEGAPAAAPPLPPAEWFLVIGQDQLAMFHTWHGWQALVSRVTLAVAGRAGEPPALSPELQGAPLKLVEIAMPPMDVSSTEIRACIAAHRSLAGLVPDAVASYIARHGLYTS